MIGICGEEKREDAEEDGRNMWCNLGSAARTCRSRYL